MFYRYCKIRNEDNPIEQLDGFPFVVSSADTFNDFFDIEVGYDPRKVTEFMCCEETMKTAEDFQRKYNYTNIDKESLLRNYMDYLFISFLVSFKHRILIGCLTSDPENVVMWSHYADDSRGFVLAYDNKDLEKLLGAPLHQHLFKVTYTNHPCDITDLFFSSIKKSINNGEFNPGAAYIEFETQLLKGDMDKSMFFTKSIEWQYEDEYRFLQFDGQLTGNVHRSIGSIKPKAIILGQKMGLQNKLALIHFAATNEISLFSEWLSYDVNDYNVKIKRFDENDFKDISVLLFDLIDKNNK